MPKKQKRSNISNENFKLLKSAKVKNIIIVIKIENINKIWKILPDWKFLKISELLNTEFTIFEGPKISNIPLSISL